MSRPTFLTRLFAAIVAGALVVANSTAVVAGEPRAAVPSDTAFAQVHFALLGWLWQAPIRIRPSTLHVFLLPQTFAPADEAAGALEPDPAAIAATADDKASDGLLFDTDGGDVIGGPLHAGTVVGQPFDASDPFTVLEDLVACSERPPDMTTSYQVLTDSKRNFKIKGPNFNGPATHTAKTRNGKTTEIYEIENSDGTADKIWKETKADGTVKYAYQHDDPATGSSAKRLCPAL